MSILALRAYLELIQTELYLAHRDFAVLHGKVRNYPVAKRKSACDTVDKICAAVDIACIWYWKQVLCLQRSAVTTCLLRRFGMPACMVIGGQQMPFKAHAWVEVDGRVVNDKPYMREMYAVLDQW
jgi:hypothetical protein